MGNVSGIIATEDFSFDEDQTISMQANNTNFLLVTHQNGFDNFKAEGIIGLNLHNNPNQKNIIYKLFEQGQISSPRFSLYLSSGSESRLYIGDYSQNTVISSLYKQMNFCAVSKKENNWSCSINSIEINKKNFPIESKFTLDSALSYLIIPISDFKIIKRQIIEETKSDCIFNENHQLLCRCTSPDIFPNIRLRIEGNFFEIKLNKLIDFYPKLTYSCRFEIFVDMNNYDNWILGANVMKDTLFSFDISSRRIGFYQNPDVKAFLNKENLVIYEEGNSEVKIVYIFAIIFILLLLYSMIKCANNENFIRGFDWNNSNKDGSYELAEAVTGKEEDKNNKMEMLKQNLQHQKSEDFEKYSEFKESKNKITKKSNNNNLITDNDDNNKKIINNSIEISDGNSAKSNKNEKNQKFQFLKKNIEVKNEKVENLIDEK